MVHTDTEPASHPHTHRNSGWGVIRFYCTHVSVKTSLQCNVVSAFATFCANGNHLPAWWGWMLWLQSLLPKIEVRLRVVSTTALHTQLVSFELGTSMCTSPSNFYFNQGFWFSCEPMSDCSDISLLGMFHHWCNAFFVALWDFLDFKYKKNTLFFLLLLLLS